MAEQLQDLLDRIQEDSVAKAEASAAEIISAAEDKARAIVEKARSDSDAAKEQAEKDAKTLTERSEKALEQSARDVVLSVGVAVSSVMEQIVSSKVDDALSPDLLKELLKTTVNSYVKSEKEGANLQVSLNPEDEARLHDFFISELKAAAGDGLEIRGDKGIIKGFTVSTVDGTAHHDFSRDAIAEALCRLLRPHLAEIVRRAVAEGK